MAIDGDGMVVKKTYSPAVPLSGIICLDIQLSPSVCDIRIDTNLWRVGSHLRLSPLLLTLCWSNYGNYAICLC
jgi:hypothetical protein